MFRFIKPEAMENLKPNITLTPKQTMMAARILAEKVVLPPSLDDLIKTMGKEQFDGTEMANMVLEWAMEHARILKEGAPKGFGADASLFPDMGEDVSIDNIMKDMADGVPPRIWSQRWAMTLLCMVHTLSSITELMATDKDVYNLMVEGFKKAGITKETK